MTESYMLASKAAEETSIKKLNVSEVLIQIPGPRNPSIQPSLPSKVQHPILRNARHRLFAVYERLFTLVFLANLSALVPTIILYPEPTLAAVSNLAIPIAVNLLVTGLFAPKPSSMRYTSLSFGYLIRLLYSFVDGWQRSTSLAESIPVQAHHVLCGLFCSSYRSHGLSSRANQSAVHRSEYLTL